MPSSVILAYSYDRNVRRLAITFTSGRRYAYHQVPADLVLELRLASSKGQFFNRRIRDQFSFTRED